MRHTAPLVARAAADNAALPNAHPSERALPAVLSAPPYTVTASPPLASAARALVPTIEASLLDCARPAAVCGGSYANVPSGVDASAEADAPTVTGTCDPAAPDGDTHWTCCQAPPSPYMPFAPCGIDGSAPTDTVPKVQRQDAAAPSSSGPASGPWAAERRSCGLCGLCGVYAAFMQFN